MIVAYLDGGARGNPGPAGFGVRIEQPDGTLVEEFHQSIGTAIARAEGERCTICQVRLRPAVFAEVRKNESLVQCDSCNRILYFIPPKPAAAASA